MDVVVIGTGYVGLVAGAGFAKLGHNVTCVDNDGHKIAMLLEGRMPIYEPGLDELVAEGVKAGRLKFEMVLKKAVANAEIIVIAVGTPDVDGAADMSAVWQVARELGAAVKENCIIVTKSTVPVGTAARILKIARIEANKACASAPRIDVGSNPEFLKEGTAVNDFLSPDRVVIGADNPATLGKLRDLYRGIEDDRIYKMSCASAELSKYAANAMLATRISFMNEMARLAERVGANITDVKQAMGSDSRIGPYFLSPGVGFGGSCFSKDLRELAATARRRDIGLSIVAATENVNQAQKHLLADRVIEYFEERGATKPVVAVMGLAFKPGTDDVRDAPSLVIIRRLVAAGFEVRAHDPLDLAIENARKALGPVGDKVLFSGTGNVGAWDALRGADALLLVTEWPVYKRLDFEALGRVMRGKVVFDGRNFLSPDDADDQSFDYYGIGGHA